MIPHKSNEKDKPKFFARTLYKARACIEQCMGRIKRFKRVALHCEKQSETGWFYLWRRVDGRAQISGPVEGAFFR